MAKEPQIIFLVLIFFCSFISYPQSLPNVTLDNGSETMATGIGHVILLHSEFKHSTLLVALSISYLLIACLNQLIVQKNFSINELSCRTEVQEESLELDVSQMNLSTFILLSHPHP